MSIAARSCPTTLTIRMILERLGQPDAAAGRHPRRLPAHPRAGRGARRGARRARRPGRPGARTSRCRRDELVRRLSGPLDLPGRRTTSTTSAAPAAAGRRASATSTARRSTSATTTSPRRSAPGSRSSCRRCTRSSTTTASAGVLSTVDGDGQPMDEVTDALVAQVTAVAEGAPDGHDARPPGDAQVAAPDREDGRRRPSSWPRSSRSSSRELKPGISTARARPHRRGRISARRGAIPSFIGVPGLDPRAVPGTRCASRSTTRSSTASPASGRSATARSCRSTPAPSSTAGTATAPRTFIVGDERPGRHATLVDGTRARDVRRHRRGPAGQPPRATSGRPSRTSPRRPASASSAHSSATASAPRCTRSRRSPTTAPARRGRASSRACAWPSSPCSRWASYETQDPRRRLDRRDGRRLARRPLGAHHRRHRRAAHPDTTCLSHAAVETLPDGDALVHFAFVRRA